MTGSAALSPLKIKIGLILLKKNIFAFLTAIFGFSGCLADDFSNHNVFELEQELESGSFDLNWTKNDGLVDSELFMELYELEEKGFLDINDEELVFDEAEIYHLSQEFEQAENLHELSLREGADREVGDDLFLAKRQLTLEQSKRKKALENDIFSLVGVVDRYKAEVESLEREIEVVAIDFQNSLYELFEKLESSLIKKNRKLMEVVRSKDAGWFEQRDARIELTSVRERLDKVRLYQAGKEVSDPLSDEFITMFEPEVLKPFTDREELIDARIDVARMQIELAAQRLDSQMITYKAEFSPWWSDPALAKAKQALHIKNIRHSVKAAKSIRRRR